MASQLNFDDLRNVRQALMIPSTFSQPSNISALILGLDVFFRSASAEFERRENVRSEFSSHLDAGVLGVHPRAEVAEGRRALRR